MSRKLIGFLCIFALLLSGCAQKQPEETAETDTVIEGTATEPSGNEDRPEVVDSAQNGQTNQQPDNSTDNPSTPSEDGNNAQNQQPNNSTDNQPNEQQPGQSTENEDPAEETVNKEGNLTLMSFNIRNGDDANGHSRAERRPRVKTIFDTYQPDVIGLMEMVPDWEKWLQEDNPGYTLLMHYRQSNNSEGLAILYKNATVELLEEDFFWLSETPDRESKGWDGSYVRICTWARFKHKATGKIFVYYNVHLDGTDTCHVGSYKLINAEMQKNSKYPCFMGGDCNMTVGSVGYNAFTKTLDEARMLVDDPTTEMTATTVPRGYPQVTGNANSGSHIIDYLFHQADKVEAVDYIVHNTPIDGKFASDHYPIICKYIL